MRLLAPVFALILTSSSLFAQQPASPADPSPQKPAPQALDVPVSLDRIRDALAQPPPAEPLKGLDERPTFRLQIVERRRFEQLMEAIKFDGGGGPEVFGGRANYEMQRLLFPPVDNPLVQPYAAFSTSEVLTLAAEALAEKLVTPKISQMFSELLRGQTEREAREEVARALAAFQTAQAAAPAKH